MNKGAFGIGILVVVIVGLVIIATVSVTTVPPGQVGVGTLLGKVQNIPYQEGFHVKNPLVNIVLFDAKQKTHKETVGVPSSDQLITMFDISVQYRLIKEVAPNMLRETGTPQEVINVHMIPQLRSLMREIGKGVDRAEDFYQQEVQQRIQEELKIGLALLAEKGIAIEKILIRDVKLPKIITDAVMRKKQASQEAEKAKEELRKFTVDQERKEAQAEAEKRAALIAAQKEKEVLLIKSNAQLEAARIEAQSIIVAAEAQKKAIELEIEAVGKENYVRLKAMDALKELGHSPSNKLIIMDPNKMNPLPFMDLSK